MDKQFPVVKVVVAVGLIVIVAFAIHRLFPPSDPYIEACRSLLPHNDATGMKLELVGETAGKLDLSKWSSSPGSASTEAMASFLACLSEKSGRHVQVADGVYIKDVTPAGQVADQWRSTQEKERTFKPIFTLMPSDNDQVLNNLRFGPAAGKAADVLRDWCSSKKAGNCVVCEPSEPDNDTINVLVRLRDKAPVVKRELPGMWPVPRKDQKGQPWELVDSEGHRSYYECSQS